MIRRLVALVVFAGLAAVAVVGIALFQPYSGGKAEAFVDIPAGTSTRGIADRLYGAGVVRNPWLFLTVRALRRRAVLQAGEYRFGKPESPWHVFGRIARGDVFYYELRVPEGSNKFDIAAELERMGLMKAGSFLQAASNPLQIQDLDPRAPSLEGYLFPAVYRMTRQTSPEQIVREMVMSFRRNWQQIAPPGADVHEIVTLASLVEKEAAVPAERPLVASVYRNRLRTGMPLDCDPTTIYAALLEGRYRGTIYRSDLDSPHPYNTYRNPGLPPGPIANPGLESLMAALKPADTNYTYFVAKPDGSGAHRFSSTLEQHNAAVAEYRRGQK